MSYVVLHADRLATTLAEDPIVPAADVARLHDLAGLLAEAARLRDAVATDVDAARAAARAEGFAAGYAEGRAAGEAEVREELFKLALRDQAALAARRADIARLAIEVVRRIAGEVGDPAMVAAIAEHAAATVAPDTKLTVRVAPSAEAATRERIDGRPGLVVEADPSLAADACVIETALGTAHAGLSTQLAQIERNWASADGR